MLPGRALAHGDDGAAESPLSCTSSEICWKSSRGAVASFLSCVAEMSSNVDDGAAGAPTAPAPQHARRTDRRSSDHALRLILRFKTGRLTIVMPLSTSSHACRLRAWPREAAREQRRRGRAAASAASAATCRTTS